MSKRAKILYGNTLAGFLEETDDGYLFYYDDVYRQVPGAKPVSLTLPVSDRHYQSKILFPFFDGLIPEGWLLDIATDHWKVNRNDRFQLLLIACRDTIGAVSVIPEDEKE